MSNFAIGQFFTTVYPPEAAAWCNANNAYIEPFNEGYVIRAVPEPPEEELAAQAVDEQLAAFDEQLKALKDRMLLASLDNDEAEMAAIRAEYNALMEA